jgi:hypothetical protein
MMNVLFNLKVIVFSLLSIAASQSQLKKVIGYYLNYRADKCQTCTSAAEFTAMSG